MITLLNEKATLQIKMEEKMLPFMHLLKYIPEEIYFAHLFTKVMNSQSLLVTEDSFSQMSSTF